MKSRCDWSNSTEPVEHTADPWVPAQCCYGNTRRAGMTHNPRGRHLQKWKSDWCPLEPVIQRNPSQLPSIREGKKGAFPTSTFSVLNALRQMVPTHDFIQTVTAEKSGNLSFFFNHNCSRTCGFDSSSKS